MDWGAIGAVGEVAGALGVLITLVYLASETHRTRVATEIASVSELASGWNRLNVAVMASPALAEAWRQGFENPAALDATQRVQFLMAGQSYSNHFTTIKKQYDAGVLPQTEFQVHADSYLNVMNSPGGVWLQANCGITPDILAFIRENPCTDGAFHPVPSGGG